MKKRVFSAIMSAVLCLTLVMTAMVFSTNAADAAKVYLSSATGAKGDTISVSVNLSQNPGLVAMVLDVSYDTSKVKLKGVTNAGVLSGYGSESDYSKSSYRLYWADDLATTNNTATGTIATMTFEVIDDLDSTTAISVSSGATYDKDMNDVSVSATGGKIAPKATTTAKPTTTTTKKVTTTTKKVTTTTKKVTTTKKTTTTTTTQMQTTAPYEFSSSEYMTLSETEIFDISETTQYEIDPVTIEPETEETTETEKENGIKFSKTKAVLIVLMVCFAIVGVAIIVSIVKKSRQQ